MDRRREAAFATRDAEALSLVYASPALARQDRATLLRSVPTGCRLVGLRTDYRSVRVVSQSSGAAVLQVIAALPAATLHCREGPNLRSRPRPAAVLTIHLVPVGAGYGISAQLSG